MAAPASAVRWKLDEVPAVAADASGGTGWGYSAGVTGQLSPLISDGGYSVRGSGTSPIASRPTVLSGLAGTNVTLAATVEIPAGNVNGPIINLGTDANGWAVGVGGTTFDNTGKQLILLTNGVAWHASGYTFTTGVHDIMAVRGAGNSVSIYVDGNATPAATVTLSSPPAATSIMAVGGSVSRGLSSTVKVDNVRLFASALSSSRAAAQWNSGAGSNTAIAADSPAVWLKLDDAVTTGATTFADASGNSHPATITGSPVLGGTPATTALGGASVTFSAGAYGLVTNPAWLNTATALSLKFWFKTSASGNAQALVTMDDTAQSPGNAGRKFAAYVDGAGKLTWMAFTTAAAFPYAATTASVNDGAWHQAVVTRSTTSLKIYLDGNTTPAATQTISGTLSGSSIDLLIGAIRSGAGTTWPFLGPLDDIEIWTSELASADVAELWARDTTVGGSTGAVAATAPSPTASIAGTVTAITTGTVAASAPAPTLSVAGLSIARGSVAASAPAPSLTVAGNILGITTGDVTATAPSPTFSVAGVVPEPITGTIAATAPAATLRVTDSTVGAEVSVGVTIEVGALTLLNLVALPGVEVPVGVGVESGDAQAVVPLPGVSVSVGVSLIARPVDVVAPDPRRRASQWRYVMTDLNNVPLGELTDLEHDPVEDGVGEPATMQFSIATDSDQHALIKPIERQCQVWDGDRLLLRGPILPGQPSDDGTTMTYKIHDPSWFWRDGRRVITRTPQKNLLHNGDFKAALSYWTRGYDKDSIPKAAPNVRVVTEDFVDDTDGLDPIKAAEIFGVESVTESELSSNAVFWPNLATFRPGGKASVEAVANAMPTTAGLKVTVVGHTANDGTGNGLGLSLRRAQAAAAVIHAKRPGAVITTKGVGFYDPKPGFPIDSQEQRRVVIQYDQTITGKSKQWMKQTVEVTHPKSARYGLELTAGAMLKVADDWSVEDANMMSVRIVARRKSAPTKIFDESSTSISDTDPVDRWIPQATSVTIPADDRTYLVDVYLYAPAAVARYTAVGLFPEEMLYFWGVDQSLIFKGVMEHIQKPEFGYADLGVGTRTPLTGIKRDREFAFRELTPADTALDGLMGISRGLEWDTVTTPTSTTATTFYPRQGKTVDYVLALGGNITAAVPANTRDVGSAIIAQAQNLGSYRAVAYASDKKAFGGTLIQRVITAEQDTPLNELRETAKAELFWAKSSTPAYWVDVDPDSIEEVLASTAKGDTVRLILDHPTQVDRLARIVRRQIHPDSLRLMVAFEEA